MPIPQKVFMRCEALVQRLSSAPYAVLLLYLCAGILLKLIYLTASPLWRVDIFFHIQGAKTILDGGVLFKDFGNSHPAGIVFLHYALIKLFGYDNLLISLKAISIILQTVAAYLLYISIIPYHGKKAAFWMGLIFLAAISINWELWPANIMLLYIPPMFGALYCLTRDDFRLSYPSLFIAGLLISLSALISTNAILFTIVIPALSWYRKRSLSHMILDSLAGFTGFCIPMVLTFYYFYINNALADWYYWNIVWASNYGNYKPFYIRFAKVFLGMLLTWEWIPLYISSFLGLYGIIKERSYKKDSFAFFALIILILSVACRFLMLRPNVRYSLYLLPGFLFLLPYAYDHWDYFTKARRRVIALLMTFVVISGFIYNSYKTLKNPIAYEGRKELRDWIVQNTSPDDKIFVWHEGYEIYYFTKRKMATSIFSPGEFLDHVAIWQADQYRHTHIPWEKFLLEFKKDKPVVVIDLRPDFKPDNDWKREGILKQYFDRFHTLLLHDYKPLKVINGAKIWKRIESDGTTGLTKK